MMGKKHYKIMIFGCPGSGKSTLAQWLSFNLSIPLYHCDKYYFTNNWKPRPQDDFLADISNFAMQKQYIIDGNVSKILLEKFLPVDLIVYIDIPLWKCYWRVFKRRFFKDNTIDDRAKGCKEILSWGFLKSMLSYKNKTEKRLDIIKINYINTKFIFIKSEEDLIKFKNNFLKT